MIINTYKSLIDKHRGESCFVIGAGPSLWYLMHNPLFTYLHTYGISIVVNSGVLAIPDFHYFISNDALCRNWDWWPIAKNGKGIKIVRNSWWKYREELKDFLYFSPRSTSEDIIHSEDEGLCYCSSIPSAIDLAIQMGCKNIFVLGLDQREYKGKHHFWQFFNNKPKQIKPAQARWKEQEKVFKFNNKSYKALRKFSEYKKCNIYNISHMMEDKSGNIRWMTQVDIFEVIHFNQIEEIVNKKEG